MDTELATTWVRRWDAQQEFYVADREERFAVIGDIVATTTTTGTVLDLGCGPGSLAGRLAERLPDARIIGVDADPLLLAMARGRYGEVEFVDADLGGPAWLDQIPAEVDAAVSTTALHWLSPEQLAGLYQALAGRIRPGGVLVNGDHLGLGDPALDKLAVEIRQGRAARAGVTENEEWSAWWAAVKAEPAFAGLVTERSQRAVAHHGGNQLSVGEHRDLLLSAGFAARHRSGRPATTRYSWRSARTPTAYSADAPVTQNPRRKVIHNPKRTKSRLRSRSNRLETGGIPEP